MEYKRFGSRIFARLDKGEEVVQTLKELCEKESITLGRVSGIGAVNFVDLGFFETEGKNYFTKEFTGDYEVTSLTGNISTMDGEIYLHLHITIGDKEYRAWGGHLNKAIVSATLEVIIDTADGTVDRAFSEEIGLNLWKL